MPTAGKHSYSAGRRQGFLWRREKSGLWERIRGRYEPQEEKVRGKVSKRKGTKEGTCAMRQNEEKERKRHWGEGEEPWRRQSNIKVQRGGQTKGQREDERARSMSP